MLALLLLACATGPRISIVDPAESDVVCGEPLVVDVDVTGFELVAMDQPMADGTGHIDLTLNGQDVMMGDQPPFDIYGMEDGFWELKAELVGNDHLSLDPPVADAIRIEIDNSVCENQP